MIGEIDNVSSIQLTNNLIFLYVSEIRKNKNTIAVASIREKECIGCTKCIRVCPTDAIIGASRLAHTVISDACTGCRRCLTVCPKDCIEIRTLSANAERRAYCIKKWRSCYKKHKKRLIQNEFEQNLKYQELELSVLKTPEDRRAAICAAVVRYHKKRERQS
ncbi:RnfABCDGE type electron transport complex subunit B [Coxiella endosymbiont of Amblyomma sculptum]|uniref:RnfABCDGE type electron transport complex subunit B n=1 Tax=Coxiella endosymbiont of Amblyomma sculptum TaxID=2487929 RepID=UPI00350E413A